MVGDTKWSTVHTIAMLIVTIVGATFGTVTYFVSASEFQQYKNEMYVYQMEDRISRTQDRIIELEKEVAKAKDEDTKARALAEKHKWEMQLDYMNKKVQWMQNSNIQQTK